MRIPHDFARTALRTYADTVTHARCAPTDRLFASECRRAFDKQLDTIRRVMQEFTASSLKRRVALMFCVCTWMIRLPAGEHVKIRPRWSKYTCATWWFKFLAACAKATTDLPFVVVTGVLRDKRDLRKALPRYEAHGLQQCCTFSCDLIENDLYWSYYSTAARPCRPAAVWIDLFRDTSQDVYEFPSVGLTCLRFNSEIIERLVDRLEMQLQS